MMIKAQRRFASQSAITVLALLFWPAFALATLVKGPSLVRSYSTPFDYGSETYKGVTVDADGTCYLVGDTAGPIQGDYTSTLSKVFIHRRAKNGSIIWQAVLNDPSYGQYALPGPFNYSDPVTGITSLDKDTLLVIYERHQPYQPGYVRYLDYWMAFISKASGQVLEVSQLRGWTADWDDRAYCVVPNGQGAFLLVENGSTFYYYDATGSLAWQMSYPFNNYWNRDVGRTFCFAPSGELIAGGALNYGGSGQQIPAVVAFSATGEKLWEKFFAGNSAQPIHAVTVDALGNIYIANRISEGPAVRKLNASGSQSWGWSYSGIDEPDRLVHTSGHLLLFSEELSGSYTVLDGAGKIKSRGSVSLNFGLRNVEAVFVNRQGHAAAVGNNRAFGMGNGDAIVETFSWLLRDTSAPIVSLTVPKTGSMAVRTGLVRLWGAASDNVSPTHLRYRLKSPRMRTFTAWSAISLPGATKAKRWSLPLRPTLRGLWTVQVQARDAAGNYSAVRTISVRRL